MEPIQTKFDGHLFRSRLEARWAVFFKHQNLSYSYEPEGFKLKAGNYLPDFFVFTACSDPKSKLNYWVEIKPYGIGEPNDPRYFELVEKSGFPLFVLAGQPGDPTEGVGRLQENPNYVGWKFEVGKKAGPDFPYFWCQCWDCGRSGILKEGSTMKENPHAEYCVYVTKDGYIPASHIDEHKHSQMLSSYDIAKSERFGVHD